ncbi:MAG: hypothetical protein NZT92_14040 [Abditibacteriales bacterium]|nr:hypothetical protein [Abditibacteriales bacterium]MDW8366249.1 hypothetical protein [Abditibacteriales bacterium]
MADEKGYVFYATLEQDVLARLLKERFHIREGEAPAEPNASAEPSAPPERRPPACALVRRVDCADVKTCEEVISHLAQWTEGQIFNENAELRWRQTQGKYAVLLLTEQNDPPDGFQLLNGAPFTVVRPSSDDQHGFLLWGTRYDKAKDRWWEARIPRPLRYPAKTHNKPPQLAYRLYQEGATVRWVRLVGLKEVQA